MMLLWSSRELRARQKMLAGQALEMSSKKKPVASTIPGMARINMDLIPN
ncbi:hypothetical protein J4536_23560 [Escherichia coli]|nr:hypothetical protein [Escherichia coli]